VEREVKHLRGVAVAAAIVVRPIFYHMRAATCWRPEVKGVKLQVNSIYNNWRMEDVWLDW
jgi:hypothetical protein